MTTSEIYDAINAEARIEQLRRWNRGFKWIGALLGVLALILSVLLTLSSQRLTAVENELDNAQLRLTEERTSAAREISRLRRLLDIAARQVEENVEDEHEAGAYLADLRRLADIDDEIEREGFGSVSELIEHLYVHHGQLWTCSYNLASCRDWLGHSVCGFWKD